MTKEITLFDNLNGDGEVHKKVIQVKDAKKIIFSVDYDYPPEHQDFIDETGNYHGQSTYFRISVNANICGMKYLPINIIDLKDIYYIESIEAWRGLYSIDVDGLQNVQFVIHTEPPTDYNTFITVKAVMIG